MRPANPVSIAAELSVVADAVEQLRRRVASLAEPFVGTEREDLITAIHEAERTLLMAERTVTRAVRACER